MILAPETDPVNPADLDPGDEPYTPTEADLAEYGEYLASLHGDDHDQQPDPNDVHAWTLPDTEWWVGIEGEPGELSEAFDLPIVD